MVNVQPDPTYTRNDGYGGGGGEILPLNHTIEWGTEGDSSPKCWNYRYGLPHLLDVR
jgi:hypothetical protein